MFAVLLHPGCTARRKPRAHQRSSCSTRHVGEGFGPRELPNLTSRGAVAELAAGSNDRAFTCPEPDVRLLAKAFVQLAEHQAKKQLAESAEPDAA